VPELMILEALPVAVERDGWDWLLYALSLAAAVTAIVLFLPWGIGAAASAGGGLPLEILSGR
jgi:hypothetical protein